MLHAQNRKFNIEFERRTVTKVLGVFSLAAASVLAFAIASRSVTADSSISRGVRRAERSNHRISLGGAAPAAARPVVSTFPLPFASITVDRTDDAAVASACTAAANDCSLRGAVAFANLNPGTTINVPAGTYQLNIAGTGEGFTGNNSIGDLDVRGNNTIITGAGAATTVIQQTQPNDRVLEVNPDLLANFNFDISGVTITGGKETTAVGGGGIISGAIDNTMSVTNCVISGNSATGVGTFGGGGISHAGGSLTITGTTFSNNSTSGSGGGLGYTAGDPLIRTPSIGTLSVSGSTFSGNTANSAAAGGGGVDLFNFNLGSGTYNINSTSFSNNSARSGRGGAIVVESGPLSLTTSSLSGNTAGISGGAVYSSGSASVTFSRLVGNTVPNPLNGLTLFAAAGAFTANDNWWGTNTGPGANDFRGVAGTLFPLTYLQLRVSASPNEICTGGTSTLTADIKQRNVGSSLTTELNGLPAFTAIFNNAVLGSISGATNMVDGVATATYTAGGTQGAGSADVTADNQTVTASINIIGTETTDPSDQSVCQGADASFSTSASGPGPFSYAWKLDGSAFNGNSASITVPTGSLSVGNHTVEVTVTGACGTAVQSATLTVQASTATTDPVDQSVCSGADAHFSTTASGTGPFSYAWKLDGSAFNGNSASITVPTGSLSVGNHTVEVTVTGACGTAVQSATLTIQAPTATTDPVDQSVCSGADAHFSTTASGTGPFHYAWTLDGSPFNGDSPSITIPTGSLSTGAHTVTVTTTGACGNATQSATLTVGGSPVITLSSSSATMWPPNHQYETFNVANFVSSASSSCDNSVDINDVVIEKVSSDELEENPNGADGNTLNDIVIAPDCKSVQLRRERDGDLNGRVYTITFKVTDSFGNSTTVTVKVSVPVSNNGSPAVDNGAAAGYTVNSACP
jgi:hypothetical protein